MSADGFVYTGTDTFFPAFLIYIFTAPEEKEDVLRKIERIENVGERGYTYIFHLAVPSLDSEEFLAEYEAGTLAVSDLKSFQHRHSRVAHLCRELRASGDLIWEAKKPESWYAAARAGAEIKRRERDARESAGRRRSA